VIALQRRWPSGIHVLYKKSEGTIEDILCHEAGDGLCDKLATGRLGVQ
jgi:hypothetical protein